MAGSSRLRDGTVPLHVGAHSRSGSGRARTYALITPARDEAANLAALAETVVGQTLVPTAWVIVDDGSTDGTAQVAADLAREHSWITLVRSGREDGSVPEGRREGRDLLALQAGIRALPARVELVTKLDADLTLPLDYFEQIVAAFAADGRLGLASGTRCELQDGRWQERHLTGSAVAAQCRTYRWACWEQVQPLEPTMGWDGIDEARAVVAGWRTLVVADLRFRHHRPMGRRDGSLFRARAAEGVAAYYMGYRPSYLLLRALWHARRELSAFGMLWGWSTALAERRPRCEDADARAYVRDQQSFRYLARRLREVRQGPQTANASVEVLVVCSSGGHLSDAVDISRAWSGRARAWVSFEAADVRSLLARERVYIAHGPTNRNIPNLLRNLRLAWRVIGETRPRVIVTTGAGVAVPFAWVGRLRRARVIYVECAGRVDNPSLSARLIAPVASRVYAQWPELAASWSGARYAGNVLLRKVDASPSPSRGSGVLVTVGMNEAPFDRLLHAVAGLDGEPVVVQTGASAVRPDGADCFDYLPHEELEQLVSSARVVVSHAGIGSVALALAHGHRPVVVPRLHSFGEAVDDHQVFFGRKLAAAGLATVVEDIEELPKVVAGRNHNAACEPGPDLAAEIKSALDELLDGEARSEGDAATAPTRGLDDSIAIVVLTHNRVHLLQRCVENVLGQTSAATREIVIWNNGSIDGTRDYLDALDDPRITVVHGEKNIGQNAYSRAFELTSSDYLVELDDDVVEAPSSWDATLLAAFRRLPTIGFLAADLEDDPHDLATHYRYRVYDYERAERNGVRLLIGPTGGACAMTSRALYQRVGGFRGHRKRVFWLEDAAYVADIARLGFGAAVLADLKVHHTGGAHYGATSPEKTEYWRRSRQMQARKTAVKRVLVRVPFVRSLNARFGWFVAPS